MFHQDILSEISKYVLHYDLRNLKFAFSEINLSQNLYSNSQNITKEIINTQNFDSVLGWRHFIDHLLINKYHSRLITEINLDPFTITFNKYLINDISKMLPWSRNFDLDVEGFFKINSNSITICSYRMFVAMILIHRFKYPSLVEFEDLHYLKEIIIHKQEIFNKIESLICFSGINHIYLTEFNYSINDVFRIFLYLSEDNKRIFYGSLLVALSKLDSRHKELEKNLIILKSLIKSFYDN